MKKINTPIITSHGNYPGHKLSGKGRYRQLFHYTSFAKFLKIWSSKELWFGSMENVNDIFEKSVKISTTNFQQMALMQLYQSIIPEYKRISFTMNYDSYLWGCMSPMMWGNYGDSGNGVCIEIDFERLRLPRNCFFGCIAYKMTYNPVLYIDPSISTEKDLIRYIMEHRKSIFFTKEISWKNENEFRIVSRGLNHLNISNAISTIYLTNCNSIESRVVELLVDEYNSSHKEHQISVKAIHYIQSFNDRVYLPVLSDISIMREQTNENKSNCFSDVLEQVIREKIKEYEKNKDINLLIDERILINNH